MENLSTVELAVFDFVKNSFRLSRQELKPAFEKLLTKLKELEHDPLETRAFMYLDIISWLESKISDTPVQTVIRNKFLEAQKKSMGRIVQ
jgi:hypothetical protein